MEADIDPDFINSRRVGRVPGKMRVKKGDKNTAKGWQIVTSDLRTVGRVLWCAVTG